MKRIPVTQEMVGGTRRRFEEHAVACPRCKVAAEDLESFCVIGRLHHGRWWSLHRTREEERKVEDRVLALRIHRGVELRKRDDGHWYALIVLAPGLLTTNRARTYDEIVGMVDRELNRYAKEPA